MVLPDRIRNEPDKVKMALLAVTHIRNVVIPQKHDGGDSITLGMVEAALREIQDLLIDEDTIERLRKANPRP